MATVGNCLDSGNVFLIVYCRVQNRTASRIIYGCRLYDDKAGTTFRLGDIEVDLLISHVCGTSIIVVYRWYDDSVLKCQIPDFPGLRKFLVSHMIPPQSS